MTTVTRTGSLRPQSRERKHSYVEVGHRTIVLQGAAAESRTQSVKRLAQMGLLRDHENRPMKLMDYAECEQKLKERPNV